MMPRMLYDRLDELGIDFGIVYPTAGLGIPRIADDETRRAVIRGFNIVTADYFAKFSDRLTPAAVIPMHTPEEAIAELEFVTKQLGSKVGMFGSSIAPAVAGSQGRGPAEWRAMRGALRPVRHRQRLRLRPGLAEMRGIGDRADLPHRRPRLWGCATTRRNFTFNHIGHFAAAGHAVAKALFLGGVTRRFPDLRFGFLEGGAGWACQLFADLIEHWERRGEKGSNT